ncbi:glycoside hydrolase family 3 protein [Crassisporium funariophilum]|nr:glycoside hydrolase family 3 protein [Crassisporium funariophilum]
MVLLTEEIKQAVGQHFVFGFHGFELSENIKVLIRDYHVGNIILFKRNIQSAVQARRLIRDLQSLAQESGHKKPLLIGIDQENGLVSAFSSRTAGTQFPGAMALAATGSANLAEQVSAASAKEMRMVGINWVYSPVADVNTDSRNPVIGVRSFGQDPNKVALFANAVSRGLYSEGVAPTAKHFPGHGDTHVDSHLALPRILKTKEQMIAEELVSFQSLIDSGIPCIMTGHMALPLITGDDTPCSLSRDITTTLLRDEMLFKGVVVTDCLEMDAIADAKQGGCGIEEGALKALKAGADVVMICHTYERQRGAVERVYQALENGQLSLEDMVGGEKRISKMKETVAGEWSKTLDENPDWLTNFTKLQASNAELSRQAYSKSTTILWNNNKVIPLRVDRFKDGKHLLLFTPASEAVNKAVDSDEWSEDTLLDPNGAVRNTAGPSYLALAQALQAKVEVKHLVYSAQDRGGPESFDGAAAVVFVMRNADVKRWQLAHLERLRKGMMESRIPVVLVSSCGPYDLEGLRGELYASWTGYVATYEFTVEGFSSLVRVLFDDLI